MSAMMGCLDLLLKGSLHSLLPMASDLWIKDVIEILSSKSLEVSVYILLYLIVSSFLFIFLMFHLISNFSLSYFLQLFFTLDISLS